MSLWNSFPGKGNKEEAGLNKGMGPQKDNSTAGINL